MLNIVTGVEKTPIKICIYGAEGVGKTSLAAQMPEPLFIDTEGGTSRLNVRRIKCTAWDVDEKYYLTDKLINCFSDMTNRNGLVRGLRFRPKGKNEDYAWTITTRAGSRATDNYIIEPILAALRGRLNDNGEYEQKLEPRVDRY